MKIDIYQDETLSKIFNRVAAQHGVRPDQVKAIYCANIKVMETALMVESGVMSCGIMELLSIVPSLPLLKRQIAHKKGKRRKRGKPSNKARMYANIIQRFEKDKRRKI